MLKIGDTMVLFINKDEGVNISIIENIMIEPIATHSIELFSGTIDRDDTTSLSNILESEHLKTNYITTVYATYINELVDIVMKEHDIKIYDYPQISNIPEPFTVLDKSKPYNFIIF